MSESAPAVEFRDVHFHYPTSDGCLHGISLAIAPSESVALIGPNGAGKSTLLLHLNGILPESSPMDKGQSIHIFATATSTTKTFATSAGMSGCSFRNPTTSYFARPFSTMSPSDRNSSISAMAI